ncbi:MAG: NusG domain II-containing protein [Lachnospiraceae bacterium]|nr:NusG domain II-containing protein [Lachnospiraceae bacterium]
MKRFSKKDLKFLILLFLLLGMMFLFRYFFFKTPGDSVTVEVDGVSVGTWSLKEEQEIPIKNSDGRVTNTLKIENGTAKMIDASCPDHLCMNQKAVSREGETIVCLPNKVVVSVQSKKEKELDAVAR